jgi:hypothetical protein
MNPIPDNYCTLPYAKKLVEAGIVLETEYCWVFDQYGSYLSITKHRPGKAVPAPSMTEVWRELPRYITVRDRRHHINMDMMGENTHVTYANLSGSEFSNINPADALIDLLIWVRKERANG